MAENLTTCEWTDEDIAYALMERADEEGNVSAEDVIAVVYQIRNELRQEITNLRASLIDPDVFNRICALQKIMSDPEETPTADEFEQYCSLLEDIFLVKDSEGS